METSSLANEYSIKQLKEIDGNEKNHLCALHSDMCFICSSILL